MKKIIKGKRALENSFFFILGAILFGSAGVLASSYILKSSDIEYKENKSVQEAVEELYTLVDNGGGSNQTLPIGEATVSGTRITIPYTGNYDAIRCIYGTNENYGSVGTINNNECTFSGSSNTKYYYKILGTNNTGEVYENSGNKTTLSGPAVVLTDLPAGVKAIIYLDPTDITKTCNEQNSTSTTGTKSGCMKWYAYKETNDSYTMILDHNTTTAVAWNSSGNTADGMNEVQVALESDTAGWIGNPRLITGQEVADITGNTSWTSTGSFFYFDTNTTTRTNEGKYYWLYDYTYNCTSYGCNIADSSTYGYWTSTKYNSGTAWHVNYHGYLYNSSVSDTNRGVRPVITISKSNL